MKLITINPNNEPYYSEEFIKGFKCGAQRQFEADKADRLQGEWIKDEDGTYRCSNCGGCEEQYIYGTENWYGCGESIFCPSCGVRMKGVDDE